MVLENKFWIMQEFLSNDANNVQSGYALYFKGDTLINGSMYKNVFRSSLSGSHPCPPNEAPCFEFDLPYASMDTTLMGHIRESINDMRVYYLTTDDAQGCYSDSQETTLFDFNKMVGDTLNECLVEGLGGNYTDDFGIIESYSMLDYFGKERNAQRTIGNITYIGLPFQGDVHIFEEVGIEGFGLFHEYNNLDILFDYCENDMKGCKLISNTSEPRLSSNIKVFPNPARDKINIEIDLDLIGAKFSILNNSGRRFQSGVLNHTTTHLSCEDLESGLYFISIQNGVGEITLPFTKL